jgi:hypothetical protein
MQLSRPALLPAPQVLVKVARAVNRSVEIGPMSAPSVLVPVVAMSQVVQLVTMLGIVHWI